MLNIYSCLFKNNYFFFRNIFVFFYKNINNVLYLGYRSILRDIKVIMIKKEKRKKRNK